MGRNYAGILGLIAFATVVTRGIVHGADAASILPLACGGLFAFAALGYLVGRIASWTVHDAVMNKFLKKLQAEREPDAPNPSTRPAS